MILLLQTSAKQLSSLKQGSVAEHGEGGTRPIDRSAEIVTGLLLAVEVAT